MFGGQEEGPGSRWRSGMTKLCVVTHNLARLWGPGREGERGAHVVWCLGGAGAYAPGLLPRRAL